MKRIVGVLAVICVIAAVCCCLGNKSSCKVLVNGRDIGAAAVIIDNRPYISIEDMGNICLARGTAFDRERESAEMQTLDTVYTFYNRQTEYLSTYENGLTSRNDIAAKPFVEKNTLYLPADLLNQLYDAEVDWQGADNKLSIKFAVSYGAFGEAGQIYCRAVRYGVPQEPTLSNDYLVVYYPNGRKVLLAAGWRIEDIKIVDGVCYFLVMERGFGEQLKLYAADLQTKNVIQLGDADFVYNRPIVAETPGFYVLGGQDDLTYDWNIEEDGVYIVGFSQKSLGDNVVLDVDLVGQTYGVWCVDKRGGAQKLIQKLSLD